MGYYTWFDGKLQFENKKAYLIFEMLAEEKGEPFQDWFIQEALFDDKDLTVSFGFSIKNYHNTMEKICLIAKTLDKDVKGNICCEGEDREDFWKININEVGVIIETAEINYKEQGFYNDEEMEKMANKIRSDKDIDSKLTLRKL